ncbi:hypothetical protein Cgig2_014731 [Carnegiea gigantea]|uniref:Heparan-alpha-glucosaminide N-acetyltransferase catalytic domain-containing protein n=1 Tax=Carnegiea gigantea TaxID=171969 RepID=A0A9Q1QRR3_9CARY|nr:hypothetical protein Cgig2_014731 [Carnegiea gigantea]
MAEYTPLQDDEEQQNHHQHHQKKDTEKQNRRHNDCQSPPLAVVAKSKSSRVASLDVFRGLCVFLMMLVDYGGSIFPIIAHAPWNGLHLADFVMPFFLFIAGVSLAIAYKKVGDRMDATKKVIARAVKLFLLGVFLQVVQITSLMSAIKMCYEFSVSPCELNITKYSIIGCMSGGYLHGAKSLTYGVDIFRVRWMGILQRISIAYLVAALCEIWLPYQKWRKIDVVRSYSWQWCIMFVLCSIYLGLLYGLYVPDWEFNTSNAGSYLLSTNSTNLYTVNCGLRGDLGPACNSAAMIDRFVLGIDHLYVKPAYGNLKECNKSKGGGIPVDSPAWCHASFDPEGILGSLTAAVTCIIGLQFGHILVLIQLTLQSDDDGDVSQDHKERLYRWSTLSTFTFTAGVFLAFMGMPLNKSLYSVSYTLITSGTAGFTFCALYLLVDMWGYRWLLFGLEWMGVHSLSIFILLTSNIAIILLQGFYWRTPENNIVSATMTLTLRE